MSKPSFQEVLESSGVEIRDQKSTLPNAAFQVWSVSQYIEQFVRTPNSACKTAEAILGQCEQQRFG